MGLIRAAAAAAGKTLADQWLELFAADSIDNDILMVRGRIQSNRASSNKFGNDNIISNGSGILVADGQCAIIVDQGEVVEICAEPGYYTYDQSTEPSIFRGDLAASVQAAFDTMVNRFKYGGDSGKDQRIYYFNTKEILDNKFGTPNPIPFRVVDASIGLDIDVALRCAGTYSLRVCDPIALYKNIAGNVASEYRVSDISDQLRAEFLGALQIAVSKLSDLGLRPSQIPAHVDELCNFMNQALASKWKEQRGIEVVNMAMNSVTLPEADAEAIKLAQKAKMNATAEMRAAQNAAATQDAMRSAASNEAGAAAGFVGMGMAQNSGAGVQAVYEAAAAQNAAKAEAAPAAGTWICSKCGAECTGNFCSKCGEKKPEEAFCPKCGKPVAAGANFCPSCGAPLA
ncbi:MAG: SPFH domain-containing protein [Clostridiales bacterium]|nr:SPFH domain-containing protein [Candidatus Crickella merdequi]